MTTELEQRIKAHLEGTGKHTLLVVAQDLYDALVDLDRLQSDDMHVVLNERLLDGEWCCVKVKT